MGLFLFEKLEGFQGWLSVEMLWIKRNKSVDYNFFSKSVFFCHNLYNINSTLEI